MQNIHRKPLVAALAGILYVTGYLILLSQLSLFSSGSSLSFFAGLVITLLALIFYAWFFRKRLLPAIALGLTAYLLGGVISYVFIADQASRLFHRLIPQVNFPLSGSFSGFWIALAQIILLVFLLERKGLVETLARATVAVLLAIIFVTTVELVTAGFGQSTYLGVLRLSIYVPVIWCLTACVAEISFHNNR